jgi:hypothetical protein
MSSLFLFYLQQRSTQVIDLFLGPLEAEEGVEAAEMEVVEVVGVEPKTHPPHPLFY